MTRPPTTVAQVGDEGPAGPVLTLECPAKVNLALSVQPVDGRGLHPIDSWMVALTFADTLEIQRSTAGLPSRFERECAADAPRPFDVDWPLTADLTVRAHQLVEAAAGRSLPVRMSLRKRIPPGSGLGGGSANAAAVLEGLNRLFDLRLPEAKLLEMARQLGADVAFALAAMHGRPAARARGYGDDVQPLAERAGMHLVLLLPPITCPTGAVYAAFDRLHADQSQPPPEDRLGALINVPLAKLDDLLFNDLLPAAWAVQPHLRDVMGRAAGITEKTWHLTGSGAACFALVADAAAAEALVALVHGQLGVAAVATRTMDYRVQPAPLRD